MTIRLRLTLLFAALLGAIGLVWGASLVAGLSFTLGRIAEADVRDKVQEVGDYLRDLDAEQRRESRVLSLRSFDALPRAFSDDGTYLQLTGPDGRSLNKSPNMGTGQLPLPIAAGVSHIDMRLPHVIEPAPALMAAQRLTLPERGDVVWIQAALPLQGHERTLERFALWAAGSWLLMVLAAFVAGYLFAGRALAPVAAMTEDVRRMRFSDLHHRLAVAHPPEDEIDRLGATFNELIGRLEIAFEAQKRFVADASHELRSPLTAIIGNLQLIRRRGASHPAEIAGWADAAEQEAGRLARMAEGLLSLARMGDGTLTVERAPVDVAALAKEVAGQFGVITPRVSYQGASVPLWVEGDRDRLKQVLINLVDNAVRATRAGGEVMLDAEREGDMIRLSVIDTGIGMPQSVLPRIFDRFYRVDAARDRDRGGMGLGLSITEAIVGDHQGRIEVQSEEGRGTRFDMRFPTILG